MSKKLSILCIILLTLVLAYMNRDLITTSEPNIKVEYEVITSPARNNSRIPDGSDETRVMSLEIKEASFDKFFHLISSVSHKKILKCEELKGNIKNFRIEKKSYKEILESLADEYNWDVEENKKFISICGSTKNRVSYFL